jgi:hypothetical protein
MRDDESVSAELEHSAYESDDRGPQRMESVCERRAVVAGVAKHDELSAPMA